MVSVYDDWKNSQQANNNNSFSVYDNWKSQQTKKQGKQKIPAHIMNLPPELQPIFIGGQKKQATTIPQLPPNPSLVDRWKQGARIGLDVTKDALKLIPRSSEMAYEAITGNEYEDYTGQKHTDAGRFNKTADFTGKYVLGIPGEFVTPGAAGTEATKVFSAGSNLLKTTPKLAPALSKLPVPVAKYGGKFAQGTGLGATYETAKGLQEELPLSEIGKNVITRAPFWGVADVGVGLAGAGLSKGGEYLSGKLKTPKLPEPEPSLIGSQYKPLGALRPRNTALDNAINGYNQAVETVQNHFGTNKLRADEMYRVKTELGIDFDKLINDVATAEKGINLKTMGERGRMAQVAGIMDRPILQKRKTVSPKSPLTPLQNKGNINTLTPPLSGADSTAVKPPNYVTGPKERQFAKSVMESNVATDDIKQNLIDNKLTYEPITNRETLDKATQLVGEDYNKAVEYFNSPSNGVSADDVALGEALITKAIKEGNSHEANRLIADLAEKLTTAGQAVQAASIFKRLTPEGMLLYAQRVVNGAQKDQIARMGAKAKKILLTAEDADFILNTMKEAQKLPEGRAKDIEIAKVMQLIANKVPATLSEKAKGLQRISLLLNPKTMIRNVGGNTLFATVDNLSNVVATPIDMVTSKFTGKRTTTLPSLTGQFKSGLEGAKETLQDARLGIDTSPGSTQFDLPNKRIFDTNALDKLDRVTRVGLELGDRPFYKAAYDDSLRQQMKLANVAEPTQAMVEQAHKIAQQRTYQDVNALTDAFKKAQQSLNNVSSYMGLSSKDFGLGNIVVPFVKTPANVLARAIEYSPVGITKAIKEATKIGKGTFDQKTFVDAISRSVTGTALIVVGYDLAKNGMITGSGNEDKDVAAFERNLGKSDYAFKYGDNYYTYDWAQPASMALAIGADIYLKGKDRKAAENVVFDAIRSGGETLLKQSVMQGIQRFMGGYSPIDNVESTIINAPTQFVPTLAKQITQLTDPLQRSTYSQSKLGTGVKAVASKIPGASKLLEPRIDTFGNEIQSYQGKSNLLNIFVNPGSSTTFKPNKVQAEITRLYESTGNKDIFPKVAPKYFTFKGQRIDLTPEEITQFQRNMGKKTEARMAKVVNELIPDKEKAKYLAKAIDLSYEEAKLELLNKRKGGG